jgi:hypothetical protein
MSADDKVKWQDVFVLDCIYTAADSITLNQMSKQLALKDTVHSHTWVSTCTLIAVYMHYQQY